MDRDEAAEARKLPASGDARPLPGSSKASYLLGTPVFRGIPLAAGARAMLPLEHRGLAATILPKINRHEELVARLAAEYRSIVRALKKCGVAFQILNLSRGDREIQPWLRENGCRNLRLDSGKPSRWQLFPRDMFVYSRPAGVLLVHSRLFKLKGNNAAGCRVIHTTLAEGGQVLFAADRMVVGRHPDRVAAGNRLAILGTLRARGVKVAAIPQALFCNVSRGRAGVCTALYHDPHIDRSAGLIQGRDGGFHLVLDPGFRTGPLFAPLSIERSAGLVQRACEKIGVQVHRPRRTSLPYAVAAVQFTNGRVLAGGGDDDALAVFAGIVSADNLVFTDQPLLAYPLFAGAGLHCLVTETPTPLLD